MKNLFYCFPISALLIGVTFLSCRKYPAIESHHEINKPPIAIAGPDQTVALPINSFNLDGSASTDPNNNITIYYWSKISGPACIINEANAKQTLVSELVSGLYQFELKVTDAGSLFSKDTVKITVISEHNACNIESRSVIQAHLVPLGKLSIGRVNIITAGTNNKILFAGGYSYVLDNTGIPIRRIDIYDINSNSWSIKDLPEYPTWRMDMGIAAAIDKIFIAGGGFWGDDIYTDRVDIYNASNNSWSSSLLSEPRTGITGVSAENKVFFAGGYSIKNLSGYWSDVIDIYDNETNTWATSTLSEHRGYVSAVAAGHKIFFVGGQKNNGQLLLSDRIDEYDILTNTWSTSALREPLSGLGTISVGNKVFFAGGQSASGESGIVEIRDVATGDISFDCIIPRAGLKAVLKDDMIVFFTGSGSDPRNGTHFEIYNLPTGTWYTVILDKSIKGAAVISVNNIIYVAGGYVNGAGSDQIWTLEF